MANSSIKPRILNPVALGALMLALGACSRSKPAARAIDSIPEVESFPIASSKFVNCRFTDPAPTYAFGTAITPNAVRCNEGVPKRIEVLSQGKLPEGLELNSETFSLVGTPKEKVDQAPYMIYLENEAGYVKVPLTLTVH